jgi:hypothetical protein
MKDYQPGDILHFNNRTFLVNYKKMSTFYSVVDLDSSEESTLNLYYVTTPILLNDLTNISVRKSLISYLALLKASDCFSDIETIVEQHLT